MKAMKRSTLCLAVALAAAAAAAGAPTERVLHPAAVNRYHTYRYQLRWRGGSAPVAGFSKVAASASPAAPAPERVRSLQKTTDVTLERGVTAAPDFAAWLQAKNPNALESLTIDEADEAGHIASSRTHTKCHAVEVQAIPDLDAGANSTRISHLLLRCTP